MFYCSLALSQYYNSFPHTMTTEHDAPDPENIQDELTERGREVWLAGLGALATVEEEGTKLFNRLVDRGQDFEEERQAKIEEATEKVREQSDEALAQLEEAGEETQSMLADSIKAALERFGVPTQTEVDDLAEKVDHLSKQVEALADRLAEDEEPSSDES